MKGIRLTEKTTRRPGVRAVLRVIAALRVSDIASLVAEHPFEFREAASENCNKLRCRSARSIHIWPRHRSRSSSSPSADAFPSSSGSNASNRNPDRAVGS